jgi:uncharacterized protein (TIGR03083 family)
LIEVVNLFQPMRLALLGLLESLSDNDWALPTVCPGWSVHDLAIHLYGSDVNVLSGDRDDFHDRSGMLSGADLSDWGQLLAYIDARNRLWVEANRRISPQLLIDLLTQTGRLLDEWWPTVDLAAIGRPVDWAGAGPAPTWVHVAREYTERWIHQQQIRDAVGRPGVTEAAFLLPVLDAFALALPVALSASAGTRGDVVELRASDIEEGRWQAVWIDGRWHLADGVTREPTTVVAMSGEIMWRLASRGITSDEARMHTSISGSASQADAVIHLVAMIVG